MTLFAWSDLNGDGQVQPEEVTFRKVAASGGVTVMPDLAMLVARVGDNAMRYVPRRFTGRGAPVYELDSGEVLAERRAAADQQRRRPGALVTPDGWSVFSIAPKPFAPQSLGGVVSRHAALELSESLARAARLARIAAAGPAGRTDRHDATAGRIRHAA